MKEQIEEMAKHCPCYFGGECCFDDEFPEKCDRFCQYGTYAEILYNAGYRKQKEGEWEYEVNHFFDDYGDLIVYVIAHCAECKTPYRDNSNVDYQRIERPEDLDAYAEWNIAVEPIKKAILERAKERKLSHHFCPNCGAHMKGGAE